MLFLSISLKKKQKNFVLGVIYPLCLARTKIAFSCFYTPRLCSFENVPILFCFVILNFGNTYLINCWPLHNCVVLLELCIKYSSNRTLLMCYRLFDCSLNDGKMNLNNIWKDSSMFWRTQLNSIPFSHFFLSIENFYAIPPRSEITFIWDQQFTFRTQEINRHDQKP